MVALVSQNRLSYPRSMYALRFSGLLVFWAGFVFSADIIEVLKDKAMKGDPVAQYQLAEEYYDGFRTEADFAMTLKWAEASKLVKSKYRLAALYAEGKGVEAAPEKAKQMFTAIQPELLFLAEKGDADAQNKLAKLFFIGVTTKPDPTNGIVWMRKSAELGWAKSQVELAQVYFNGHQGANVQRNLNQAIHWFQKAADQENPIARLALSAMNAEGLGMPRNLDAAKTFATLAGKKPSPVASQAKVVLERIDELSKLAVDPKALDLKAVLALAEKGNAAAQFDLGMRNREGMQTAQDYVAAQKWLEKAAEQGHPLASYHVGGLYFYGRGMPKDRKKAIGFWKIAAEAGVDGAQSDLGLSLVRADGVEKDLVEAYKWFAISARSANPEVSSKSAFMREDLAKKMELEQIFEAQKRVREFEPSRKFAMTQLFQAAAKGDADAQLTLARAHLLGEGVKKNEAEAYYWFALAALHGQKQAETFQNEVADKLPIEKLIEVKKRVKEFKPAKP